MRAHTTGATSQALVRFAAKSATFVSFDIGKVSAVQVRFRAMRTRSRLTELRDYLCCMSKQLTFSDDTARQYGQSNTLFSLAVLLLPLVVYDSFVRRMMSKLEIVAGDGKLLTFQVGHGLFIAVVFISLSRR